MAFQNPSKSLYRHPVRLLSLLVALSAAGCDVSNNSGNAVHDGDPAVVDFPIAYVYRPIPVDAEGEPAASLLDPAAFHPGAQLVIRDRASASARERVLTDALFPATAEGLSPQYDVKDLSVSSDGSKLLFSLRAPADEDADESEQPTWDIWQYDITTEELKPVMSEGAERGDDVAPRFLPSGGIVFSSNRQARTRAILTDELKPQYSGLDDKREREAFVLHTMDSDGDNVEQITYNVSHDLQPTVLNNGDLLFVRHDGINAHNQISWYTAKTDGSDVQPYYGYHSQNTGTERTPAALTRPQVLSNGRLLAVLQPRASARLGGDIVAVDGANFIDIDQPTSTTAGSTGPGQVSLSVGEVNTISTAASLGGTYHSAYPFYDGTDRLLVSWSPCRSVAPQTGQIRPCTQPADAESPPEEEAEVTIIPAPPLYGLWTYDPADGTQLPIVIPEESYMYSDAVVMAATARPTPWQPEGRDADLIADGLGLVHIRNVYDIGGESAKAGLAAIADPAQTPTDQRPIRFLRIVKNVPIPNDDVLDFDGSAFGRTTAHGMREIIGYVPVEPDGSVLFEVPADIAFTFDLLDARGQRVSQRHENWLYVRPGEERECSGCHTRGSTLPHGRRDAEYASINAGATGGIPFANTRLIDEFGTPHPYPQFGETMAEYYARVEGPRTPSADILFTDEWTNPASAEPGADIQLRYLDVAARVNVPPPNCDALLEPPPLWVPPTFCVTADSWTTQCRSTINYLDSIAPLWQADRRTCDEIGDVVTDNTCTSCHTRTLDGMLQEPEGQLELTGEPSTDRGAFATSYVELLFNDNAQERSGGALVDVMVPSNTGEIETDDNGEPILDQNGEPIPVIEYTPVPVPATMSANGARDSEAFFSRFREGGSHQGMLSSAELKLIAEWLDIGAQYYNNPFDAPAD